MSTSRVSFCAVLILGLLLLSRSSVIADPPADDCVETCQEKKYFIFQATLRCAEFPEPSCILCMSGGRCRDTLDGFPPRCAVFKGMDGKEVELNYKIHDPGACTSLCNLNVGKTSQSSPPSTKNPTEFTYTKLTCQPETTPGPE